MNNLHIYTDGSYYENSQSSGCAFAVVDLNNNLIYEKSRQIKDEHLTSQRSELYAVLDSLLYLLDFDICYNIEYYCDSTYVVKSFGYNGWAYKWNKYNWTTEQGELRKNHDLLKKIYKYIQDMKHKGFFVKFYHVKSHSNSDWNNHVDKLAKSAAIQEEEFDNLDIWNVDTGVLIDTIRNAEYCFCWNINLLCGFELVEVDEDEGTVIRRVEQYEHLSTININTADLKDMYDNYQLNRFELIELTGTDIVGMFFWNDKD